MSDDDNNNETYQPIKSTVYYTDTSWKIAHLQQM